MSATRLWSAAALAAAGLASAPVAHAAAPPATVTAPAIAKALTARGAKTTVTVRNTSKRRLTGLSLRPATTEGVRVRVSGARRGVRAVGPLAAGRSTRFGVTLHRAGGGPKAGRVTLRLRRNGRTIATGRVVFGPKAAPAPTPAPAPKETLTGRYYWGSRYTINGIEQYTLIFTGPDLVFTGDTDAAYPSCTAATETCRPYTYDPATRALTIDGRPATIEGNTLTRDGQAHFLLGAATAGARWDTVLTYSNSTGLCPLHCTYYTEHLTFRPDGTFIRGAVASGTGSVDYGVIPPDQKGVYEVRADRTLRLAFADGTERIATLGVFPDDAGGYPANPSAGIVLGGDGYFDIRD
jgi:hypothetical protein